MKTAYKEPYDESQATVQASGQVEEVPEEEQNEAYHKLVLVHPSGEFSWKPPVSKLNDDGRTVVLKLRPTLLQFAEFKSDSHLAGDHIVSSSNRYLKLILRRFICP
jgi:hypothetical protein